MNEINEEQLRLAVDRDFLITTLEVFVCIVLFNLRNVHIFDHQAAYFFISNQFNLIVMCVYFLIVMFV
jgi:hypothetical protein